MLTVKRLISERKKITPIRDLRKVLFCKGLYYISNMKYLHNKILMTVVLLIVCVLTACPGPELKQQGEYLIRVGERVVTVLDFQKAFEIAKAAYPHNVLQEPAALKEARTRLLNQMTEELVLLERAKELNISISDMEVEKAVAEIKSDYPDNVFEEILLEYAVSYKSWEKGLRTRLLIDKLVEKELSGQIVITADDISKYYEKNYKADKHKPDWVENSQNLNEKIVKHLRRKKIEKIYKSWIVEIQKRYNIEINEEQWEKIIAT